MVITNINQLQSVRFSSIKNLLGCTTFKEFEEQNDNLIFYADGEQSTVVNAMLEDFHARPFKCVELDGWYIALLHT